MILIGFVGAGKTNMGEELAGRLKRTLIDMDRMVKGRTGMNISDIFAIQGEEAFRRLETEVLEQLISGASGKMISVGGGLPLREEDRELLKKLGTVIHLHVRPETVLARLKGDTTRPLLQGDDVEEKVDSLLSRRGPIYEMAAGRIIFVGGRGVEQIVDAIIAER